MYGNGYQYGKIFGGGGLPFTPPLDVYTGAAAAYSLRLLRSAYAGSAIRVRRSSDSAESDIGFVSGALDTASLLTFCGAGDGFVTTWYDQSGNGYDATQTTAANQPKIYDSVSGVIEENGKPCVDFDGSNDALFLTSNTIMYTSDYSTFFATRINVTNITAVFLAGGEVTSNYKLRAEFHVNTRLTEGYRGTSTANDLQTLSASQQYLISFVSTGMHTGQSHNVASKVNGGTVLTSNPSGLLTPTNSGYFSIGNNQNLNGATLDGIIQEVIVYNSDQSSNRTGIETNINSYYGIY